MQRLERMDRFRRNIMVTKHLISKNNIYLQYNYTYFSVMSNREMQSDMQES